jgi:quinoprotein glucose dehydrogenase
MGTRAGADVPAAASASEPTGVVQDPGPIWDGVFTAAQAERGRATYARDCSRCHRDDLSGDEGVVLNGERYQTLGPALTGDTFFRRWGHASVSRLFRKIRDTMPPDFQSVVDDGAKIDVVAFLLQQNGFPVGPTALTRDPERLDHLQIVRRTPGELPNFALVQVTGCVEPAAANRWRLTAATTPVLTRDGPLSAADREAARRVPRGADEFLLLNTASFDVDRHRLRRVVARGLVYREPGRNRLTVSVLQPLEASCQD